MAGKHRRALFQGLGCGGCLVVNVLLKVCNALGNTLFDCRGLVVNCKRKVFRNLVEVLLKDGSLTCNVLFKSGSLFLKLAGKVCGAGIKLVCQVVRLFRKGLGKFCRAVIYALGKGIHLGGKILLKLGGAVIVLVLND